MDDCTAEDWSLPYSLRVVCFLAFCLFSVYSPLALFGFHCRLAAIYGLWALEGSQRKGTVRMARWSWSFIVDILHQFYTLWRCRDCLWKTQVVHRSVQNSVFIDNIIPLFCSSPA